MREASNHPKLQLEDRARAAEERKQRGESPGFTLEAIPPTKRKYDTAPGGQRAAETERKVETATKAKGPIVEDFAPAVGIRSVVNDAKPTLAHATQIRPVPPASVPLRPQESSTTSSASRSSHKPRAGFFPDERRHQLLSQPSMQPPVAAGPPQTPNRPQREQPLQTAPAPKPIQTSPAHQPPHQSPLQPAHQPAHQTVHQPVHIKPIFASPQRSSMPSQPQNIRAEPPSSASGHVVMKHDQDSHFRRPENLDSRIPFPQPSHSPTSARFSNPYGPPIEPARPHSTPAQSMAESQRLAAPKRSNLMSLLNDEQPKSPPRKRPGVELERTPSYPSSYAREGSRLTSAPQREDLIRHQAHSPYDPVLDQPRQQPLQPHRSVGSGSEEKPVVYSVGDDWVKKFDPRQQSSASSPDPPRGPVYSTQPPSTGSLGHQQVPNAAGIVSTPTQYQHRVSSHHSLRPASPGIPSTQPHYQAPRSASSQGTHSRIGSYSQSQAHLAHQPSIPNAPQAAPTQPGSSHTPAGSYDGRPILIDSHRQPEGYNYTIHQPSKPQPQQQIQPQRPEWQTQLTAQMKMLQNKNGQQLQQQPQQALQRAPELAMAHPLRSQPAQPTQLAPETHRSEQTYYSSQPQSQSQARSYGLQSYSTQPPQAQPQHDRAGQRQAHGRHYSHGGAEGSR